MEHGESDTVEYVPVQNIMSDGLTIGKIASGNEFEFSADIGTSVTTSFLTQMLETIISNLMLNLVNRWKDPFGYFR